MAQFPTTLNPSNTQVTLVNQNVINTSMSGRETRTQISRPYFSFELQFPPLEDADRRLLAGHYASARGLFDAFLFLLPTNLQDGSGDTTATISVTGSHSAGAISATYSKVSAANETVFKAGDLIQFYYASTAVRSLHQVTADSVSSGTTGTVNFYPPLNEAVTTTHEILYNDLVARVRYADNVQYEIDNALFSGFTIVLNEVLE